MASILDDISSVNMLESLITRDSRWEWILDEWESSDDEQLLGVSATVHRFRASFVKETGGMLAKLLGDIDRRPSCGRTTEF